MKDALKRNLPAPVWGALAGSYRQMRRAPHGLGSFAHNLEWQISPQGRESRRRLRQFKDIHRGERCFIWGNGPSLGKMDLSPLAREVTFGLNRIYLMYDKLGFTNTYFVAVNGYVIEQCAAEMSRIPGPKFINWQARRHIKLLPDMAFIRSDGRPSFSADLTRPFWDGVTVTYVAMQIAYYMGFSQVILIGVDHHFETKGEPGKLVTLEGGDPNHFDPRYFARGFRWQLPDLPRSEMSYSMAKQAYEADGRRIVDATVGGALQVFDKVNFDLALEKLRGSSRNTPLDI